MKPVERSELLGLGAYEQIREQFRRRIIELKRVRRFALGSNMSALFENHDTVLFQIQEMLRTERISTEAAISHELHTYNSLIASGNELSVTLFIEYPDKDERERMLRALASVETCFFVTVNGQSFGGGGPKRGDRTDRTTAVHYLKFPISDEAARAIQGGAARVTIGVDHPAYRAETELGAAALTSLREDFD
jgi:hypothetical protein